VLHDVPHERIALCEDRDESPCNARRVHRLHNASVMSGAQYLPSLMMVPSAWVRLTPLWPSRGLRISIDRFKVPHASTRSKVTHEKFPMSTGLTGFIYNT
jgi:hypothetical protein